MRFSLAALLMMFSWIALFFATVASQSELLASVMVNFCMLTCLISVLIACLGSNVCTRRRALGFAVFANTFWLSHSRFNLQSISSVISQRYFADGPPTNLNPFGAYASLAEIDWAANVGEIAFYPVFGILGLAIVHFCFGECDETKGQRTDPEVTRNVIDGQEGSPGTQHFMVG